MNLPQDFTTYTSTLFGPERWARFLHALNELSPVSVRLNPWKKPVPFPFASATPVPWCKQAYWLSEHPNFTLDPLFHAGVYYVQEAASLFLDHVLREHVTDSVTALDLCAAPGGKSTLMRAALPQGSVLVSNEPDRRRANILLENMLKQGHPDVLVTHNFAHEFATTDLAFDVILTDIPCSGEGLFRRDEGAINEWSLQNVHMCQERQRKILKDIWPCLRTGGLLIYSTCTFNTRENEENVRWLAEELGAEILSVSTKTEWKITGSLLNDFEAPVYRFIPGVTKSEGLFKGIESPMAVWSSHKDEVNTLPENFEVLASSSLCDIESMKHLDKEIYGIQFHPEVHHTPKGEEIFKNFYEICQKYNEN